MFIVGMLLLHQPILYLHVSMESSPVTSVHIFPIQNKTSILNKEQLKRSYQASDFLHETEISPSRSELMKNKVKKVEKTLCFLTYINNDQGTMISFVILPTAPTNLLNDGSYTCFHPVLGTSTAIDRSLCPPNIRMEIDFLVESESYSSDHCFKNLCIAS